MRFIATLSFSTGNCFDSEKDDAAVNRLLQQIQSKGGTIGDIRVKLSGREMGATALYVVEYEADSPISLDR